MNFVCVICEKKTIYGSIYRGKVICCDCKFALSSNFIQPYKNLFAEVKAINDSEKEDYNSDNDPDNNIID